MIKVNSICTEITSEETLDSIGKVLKQARQRSKVRDLNVIAEELYIKPHLLEALEQDDFASFPSSCYATGFLKNYATYLALDAKDMVARYEAEYAGLKDCVVLDFPEVEKYNSLPLKSLAGIATLCVAIFVGVWSGFDKLDAEEFVAASNFNSSDISANTNNISNIAVIGTDIAVIGTDEVHLKANQDVWVRLSEADGTIRVEKIFQKGEDLVAPEEQGLSLMTNNAAALSIYVDGEAVSALGDEGEIIENIAMKQEKLLELSMLD